MTEKKITEKTKTIDSLIHPLIKFHACMHGWLFLFLLLIILLLLPSFCLFTKNKTKTKKRVFDFMKK